MFGIFAGCYNSHLVCFDQCRETSFIISSFKHVLGNLFAFILVSLSFFSCNLASCTNLLLQLCLFSWMFGKLVILYV